ncbi:MAG: Ig-like domain-containing protein [Paludibacteraceae bacterium]|nr:Ig-like domain-containing protein [Paludibacteraceae bacterium]
MKSSILTPLAVFFCIVLVTLSSCKNKEPQETKLKTLAFTESSYTIMENDHDLNLRKKLVGTPEGIIETAKISWTVSDEDVAEMNGSFIIPSRDGEVTVTATIQGLSASCKVIITEVPVEKITLKAMNIAVGESKPLEYETEPEGLSIKRFTLTSGKESVATVGSDGMVYGVEEGSTTVTAKCGDVVGTCNIVVNKVPVSSVTLNQKELIFTEPKGTATLTATVAPENASYKTVTWSSSNTSVATVSKTGEVTVLKYGDAVITATADGKSATCAVKAQPILVTKITLSKKYYRFTSTGSYITLTYTYEPANATEVDIVFESSNISVASVSQSGVITCQGFGFTAITCKDKKSGVSAVCAVGRVSTGTVTDCQGHTYPTVKIGDQWWMAENLRCTKYDTESPKYGGRIYYSPTPNQYEPYVVAPDLSAATNMTSAQKEKAGLYYNWAAAVGTDDATSYAGGQGICPNGWRMPSKSDWATLRSTIQNLTGQEKIGVYLVSTSGWNEGNRYGGYDLFGFNGLPVGYYNNYKSGQTLSAGTSCLFWSSGKYNQASYLGYDAYYTDIWGGSDGGTIQEDIHKACYHGLPVRCIKQ